MLNEQLREYLSSINCELILFENPNFDNSIIGVSSDNNHIVYSYNKMLDEFACDNDCSVDDAAEFLDYNTIRALTYESSTNRPIILMEID